MSPTVQPEPAFARGLVVGLLICLPFWALILYLLFA